MNIFLASARAHENAVEKLAAIARMEEDRIEREVARVLTHTPEELRAFLIERGILKSLLTTGRWSCPRSSLSEAVGCIDAAAALLIAYPNSLTFEEKDESVTITCTNN